MNTQNGKAHDTRYEWRLVILFAFGWGFLFLDRLCISYMMPTLTEAMSLTNAQVGLLGSVNTICFAISSIVVGILSDRSGYRKRWLIPFVFATAIFSGLCAVSTNHTQLMILRGLVGLAEGPIMALIYSLLAPASTDETYGRNTGIVNVGAAVIAVTLGPVAITQLLSISTWQMTFLLASIPSAILGLIMIKAVKERKTEKAAVPDSTQKEGGLKILLEALRIRNVLLCCLIGIVGFGAYWVLMLYVPLYWTSVVGKDIQSMGFVTSGMGVLAVVYCFFVPKISDVIGRKTALLLFYFTSMLAPFSMALFAQSDVTVYIYMMLAGIPCATLPIFMSIVPVESSPDYLRASAGGLVVGIGELIGGSVIPAWAGRLADQSAGGLTTTMLVGAVCLLIAGLLSIGLKESNAAVLAKRAQRKGQ